MKTLIWSKDERTIMSIKASKITLKVGKNFDRSRIRDLLRLTARVLNTIVNTELDCYVYFKFETTKVTVTLSANSDRPSQFDLRYKYDW